MVHQAFPWDENISSPAELSESAPYEVHDQTADLNFRSADPGLGEVVLGQEMPDIGFDPAMGMVPIADENSHLPDVGSWQDDSIPSDLKTISPKDIHGPSYQGVLDPMHGPMPESYPDMPSDQHVMMSSAPHPMQQPFGMPFSMQEPYPMQNSSLDHRQLAMQQMHHWMHNHHVHHHQMMPNPMQPSMQSSLPSQANAGDIAMQQSMQSQISDQMQGPPSRSMMQGSRPRHFFCIPPQTQKYLAYKTDSAGNPTKSTFGTFYMHEHEKSQPDEPSAYPSLPGIMHQFHRNPSFRGDASAPGTITEALRLEERRAQLAREQTMEFELEKLKKETEGGQDAASSASKKAAPKSNKATPKNRKKRKVQIKEGSDTEEKSSIKPPVRSRAKRSRAANAMANAQVAPPPSESLSEPESNSDNEDEEESIKDEESDSETHEQTAPKTGRGRWAKPSFLEIVEEDKRALERLATPNQPNGMQHYILTRRGFIYDSRLNSQEDLNRWVCQRVTELEVLGPKPEDDKTRFSIEFFPFNPYLNNLAVDQPQFWLTGAAISCIDYDHTLKMLQSGSIQSAVSKFRSTTEQAERMWLLILLRLAASHKAAGELLKYSANDIFAFLQDTMIIPNEHFFAPVRKRTLCDSRGYEYFLVTALGAHMRPLLDSTRDLPFDRETNYRRQVQIITDAFKERARSSPHEFSRTLSAPIRTYYDSLTTHDMALEIFVDLAKFGYMEHFGTNLMNARWSRALNKLVWYRGFDQVTVKMCNVLHAAPQKVIAKMENPYRLFVRCFKNMSWAMRSMLDESFLNQGAKTKTHKQPALGFINSCARALIAMHKNGESSENNKAVIEYIRNESSMAKLIRFIFALPFCDAFKEEQHQELYECIWALVHNAGYTFPLMVETMLRYACDDDCPLHLAGHAGLFVGSVIVYTKYEATFRQVLKLYNMLKQYAMVAPNVASRKLRLEIVFRLGIVLEGEKYELKHTIPRKGEVEDVNKARTAFAAYKFKESEDIPSPPGMPTTTRINMLALFEEGRVELAPPKLEDLVVDDGKFPVLTFQQRPDGTIVKASRLTASNSNPTDSSSVQMSKRSSYVKPAGGESKFKFDGKDLDSDEDDGSEHILETISTMAVPSPMEMLGRMHNAIKTKSPTDPKASAPSNQAPKSPMESQAEQQTETPGQPAAMGGEAIQSTKEEDLGPSELHIEKEEAPAPIAET